MVKTKNYAHTFLFMAILTLISKLFGFFREMMMANYYGASYVVDSYVMAVAIPSIIFGGAFIAISISFMPTLSYIYESEGEKASSIFTSEIINIVIIMSIIASIIGALLSDQIVSVFANGFTGNTAELTSSFLKVAFFFIIFTSVASIFDAYIQYKGGFYSHIISGYFYNFAIVASIIISAYTNHYFMIVGVLVGSILRLAFIGIIAKKRGYNYVPKISIKEPIRRIFNLAVPVFIGTYVLQINSFVDKTLASRLPVGSVSALNYGMILITLITGLTISVLITLIYPKITKANTAGNLSLFNKFVEDGISIVVIISVPFSFGILVYSSEVVQVVYERGEFLPLATDLTSGAFFFYGIGLVFFGLNDILTKVYYSMRDTKVPIICSAFSVVINISLNLMLIGLMAHQGLALATSISAIANSFMLILMMKRKYPSIKIVSSKRKIVHIIISAFSSVVISRILFVAMNNYIWMPRMFYLFISVVFAVIIYIFFLKIFKVNDIDLLMSYFRASPKERLEKGN